MSSKMTQILRNRLSGGHRALLGRSRNDAGYTLLELLVVMGILAVLTAVATPQLMGCFGKAKTQSAQIQIENIGTALEMYYMENGSYPSASAGLQGFGRSHARGAKVERSLSQEGQEPAGSLGTPLPVQLSRFERGV